MQGNGDYISREAALALTDDYELTLDDDEIFFEYIDPKKVAALPAADVRPVVCCKDCVYAYPYGLEIKCTKHSGKADRLGEDATYSEFHSENWYCADAQRKRGKHG